MEIVIGYIIVTGLIIAGREMLKVSRFIFIAQVLHGILTYE